MMKNQRNIGKMITNTFTRYHAVIFIVAITSALTIAVFLLNRIASKPSDYSQTSANSQQSSFDEATISRIEKLKASDEEVESLDFSKGRISPFSE